MESYMIVAISSVTNLKSLEFTSLGTFLSSNFALIGIVELVGFPLWSLIFMKTRNYKLHTGKMIERYGSVYQGLNIKRRGIHAMTEPIINMYRMLGLTFALIFLQEYRYF